MLSPDEILLTGRAAVVTGAAVGIGEAVALALARFGADVAVCDRNADELADTVAAIEGEGRRAVSGVLDVRDADAVAGFLERVAEVFGRVDVLVNNAGGTFAAPFVDVSRNGEASLIAENFTSATDFIRGCVPLMTAGGSIVNITSIEGHRAGPAFAVYSAMKAALANLTKSLALELGERMIRVNCVAPDVIPTPGIGQDLPVTTPLPRQGHVDDVAGAVVFLASDLAGFVTGTTVHVDGGNLAAGGWHRQPDGSFRP
ncbi:MAG TPA: SDR family oxidoreductase [Acidimicrobiia bacterium]|nr:SDR family oxidoreductase [Acidimicrobiia bacterium]